MIRTREFISIEYIDGQSIQNWLDQLGRFSVADAVFVAIVSAEALKHAHSKNMVHRDIKPDNILVTQKGIVKVADFGLAKAMDEEVSMTQSGTGLGTPLYMAPEQARNAKHVDERVDIYALGATLYHLLTGKLPFLGNTALELILAKEKGTYPTARSLRPEVPERLDLVIDKMMAKDPNHRYKNCDEVLHDLVALGIHGDVLSFIEGARPMGPGLGGASTPSTLGSTQGVRKTMAATQLPGSATLGSMTDAAMGATRIWYVQFEDQRGKTVVEKHSTGRLLKMLASAKITAKARAKVSADGTYYPLAQFPEFASAVEDSLARKSVAIRKEDMQSLYKNVDKAQKMFYLKRKLKDMGRNAVSMIGLLIMLAAIGVLIFFVIQYGKTLPQKVMDMIGWGEKSGEEKPVTPEGMVPEANLPKSGIAPGP
ncbi:MAG: serine/threonine-protein kinase [Planctomycetota bacterium]|nr:serine/threonine-protein kinase [Planctomycetota bacterium]